MATYTVHFTTTASLSVEVEVDDSLDEHDAREAAIEKAYDVAPTGVCAQCGGWGQGFSLDLGEWDVSKELDGSEIKPLRH